MVEFSVDLNRLALVLLLVCVAAEASLFALDWHVNYAEAIDVGAVQRLFNATREDGIASWFAVTQTFLVGLTALVVFQVRRKRQCSWAPWGWLVLALFFFYMSVDDGSKLHERLGTTFKVLNRDEQGSIGSQLLQFFPSYTWQLVFLPAFGALGLFVLWFLWRDLADPALRWVVVAAIGCLVVAVGLDFVEGLERDHPANLYTHAVRSWDMREFTIQTFRRDPYSTLRHFSKTLEECLEMLGNSLLWYVFLVHLGESAHEVRVRFTRSLTQDSQSATDRGVREGRFRGNVPW